MFQPIILLLALVSIVLGSAAPAVTLAARSPAQHEDRVRLLERRRYAAELFGRQEAGDLSFCYGENSICAKSNDLNDECDKFYGLRDSDQWYECLCSNGYVATRQA